MRAVVQRVSAASVTVDSKIIGQCGLGLMVLVAAHREDQESDAELLADRIMGLRIFADENGKMNLAMGSLPESELPRVLAVSNFTLFGEGMKNRRPSFTEAADYVLGETLFEKFVSALRQKGIRTDTGEFGAHMEVSLVNNGPVTIILDTKSPA